MKIKVPFRSLTLLLGVGLWTTVAAAVFILFVRFFVWIVSPRIVVETDKRTWVSDSNGSYHDVMTHTVGKHPPNFADVPISWEAYVVLLVGVGLVYVFATGLSVMLHEYKVSEASKEHQTALLYVIHEEPDDEESAS